MAVAATPAAAQPPSSGLSILALDQCADQFVMAMARPGDRLTLSPRADDPDSAMRHLAAGHKRARAGMEAVAAARPDVAVRYWGGGPALLRGLERRGVMVVTIEDATTFEDVRGNVRAVAAALGRPEAGRRLLAGMDADLAAAGRTPPVRGAALYLTAGGYTAGRGTLIDSILRAAGLGNAAGRPGFQPVSMERAAMSPPLRFVLGFFEDRRRDRRGAGRHPVLRRQMASRPVASLAGAELGCPAWFAATAARRLAEQTAAEPG